MMKEQYCRWLGREMNVNEIERDCNLMRVLCHIHKMGPWAPAALCKLYETTESAPR